MQEKILGDAILTGWQSALVRKIMTEDQQNQERCARASSRFTGVMRLRLLPMSYLTLTLLAVSACGEAPSDPPAMAPASTATDEAQDAARSVIEFSFAGEQLEFPAMPCRITAAIVMIQGKNGETVVDLLHDGRPKVGYRHHFERDGVRYWDQWDSKRDNIEYSVDGSTVTAIGTMGNTNQWREGSNGGWENVSGSYGSPDDQAFTFSVTCN